MTKLQAVRLIACLALAVSAGGAAGQAPDRTTSDRPWRAGDESFYHVFVRSFRDSDGDRIGDLDGITQSLDYLQALGVTSLLLTPIQPSPFYHNYFATSFEGVDPDYGDQQDWQALVTAVHARGMKIYLDVEIQYVAEGHEWWRESAGNPQSRYSRYLLYHGPGNTRPESAVYGLTTTPTYDGQSIGLASVNLNEPEVRRYFERMLLRLADPDGDGRIADGVDGFRIDHMMDDLDNKKLFTNLFASFWAPIFASLRQVNPDITLIAEQYDWGYGEDFLTRGGTDMVFAFPIRNAIVGLQRDSIVRALAETVRRTPPGKGQLVFIENHDVNRHASEIGGDPRKQKAAAALNVLLVGTPILYYGQEIGMRGRKHEGWTADGQDIPDREAFEWTRQVEGPGAATWYQDGGPWWTERYARDDDGVSVEEQQHDPASLLSFYRRLLALRRTRPELRAGELQVLSAPHPDLLAVSRTVGDRASVLLVNLGDRPLSVTPPLPQALRSGALRELLTDRSLVPAAPLELAPWAAVLLAPTNR